MPMKGAAWDSCLMSDLFNGDALPQGVLSSTAKFYETFTIEPICPTFVYRGSLRGAPQDLVSPFSLGEGG